MQKCRHITYIENIEVENGKCFQLKLKIAKAKSSWLLTGIEPTTGKINNWLIEASKVQEIRLSGRELEPSAHSRSYYNGAMMARIKLQFVANFLIWRCQ